MTDEAKAAKPTIKPRENGSLRVDGLENLLDAQGNRLDTTNRGKGNIALCRCGQSRSKPFCDGNHRNAGFRSAKLSDGERDFRADYEGKDVAVHDNRGVGAEHRDHDRPPTIQVLAAGPYLVTGGVELLDTERGEGVSQGHYKLCRCGHSKNHPFCDGTHSHVDFDDPGLDTADPC